jgi:hypothetical protein
MGDLSDVERGPTVSTRLDGTSVIITATSLGYLGHAFVRQDGLFRLHTSSLYPKGYSEYWRETAGEGQCQE